MFSRSRVLADHMIRFEAEVPVLISRDREKLEATLSSDTSDTPHPHPHC